METEKTLQEIGLTKNEAKIYIALQKSGSSLVSAIAEETKLNRTHIYDRLNHLIKKGIVSYHIQGGKKYFTSVQPEKLIEKAQEKLNNLNSILPQLKNIAKDEEKISIEIYKGKEGLKTLLQDIIKEKKNYSILGFAGAVAKELEYFYPHFQKQREKLEIKRKIIADYNLKNSRLVENNLSQVKFLPKEYQSPSGTWIYGDKTVIFLPENELTMILIKSQKIAKTYNNYFSLLWKSAKP